MRMIDKRFHSEAKETYNDEWKQLKRALWLSEVGRDEGDVMMNVDGTEFVIVENETDHSDGYSVYYSEQVLPDHLQTYHVEF